MYDTKSLKCSLRHSMHLYAQVWLACQAARIKKHPGKGEWLLVQKFGSSVFSYTTSFVFMSSWWMQCNLTLIVSKSSWKVCNRITIYLFSQPTTWQHDKSQGYHQWSVTSDNNSMWAKEGFLYFSKKKKANISPNCKTWTIFFWRLNLDIFYFLSYIVSISLKLEENTCGC